MRILAQIAVAGILLVGFCESGYSQSAELTTVPIKHQQEEIPLSSWGPIQVHRGPLIVKMVVEQLLGRNSVSIILSNPSNEFFCINSQMFDTTFSYIRFFDKRRKRVRQLGYGETIPTPRLGFDYNDFYTFLFPGETRKIDINAQNFELKSGLYGYEIILLYYRCHDVIDSARIKAKKDIKTFSVHVTGTVTLPREE